MSIKNIIKKIPFAYKLLSFILYKVIMPFKSGFVKYYIYYCLSIKPNEIKQLKKRGFKNIKPFQPNTWRRGLGKDGAHRRYYLAIFDNDQCFIKVGKRDTTVKNEVRVAERLGKHSLRFVVPTVCFDKCFDDETVMIASKFVKMHSITQELDCEKFASICKNYTSVLDNLRGLGIIHADIHKGNLMLDENNALILLDFGISIVNGMDIVVDYKARPGTFYVNSEDGMQRTYDDAYSFVKMVELLGIPNEWKKLSEYSEVKQRVGSFSVTIDL